MMSNCKKKEDLETRKRPGNHKREFFGDRNVANTQRFFEGHKDGDHRNREKQKKKNLFYSRYLKRTM